MPTLPEVPADEQAPVTPEAKLVAFMYPNLGDAPVTIYAKDQAEADAKAAKLKADMQAQKTALS